MLVLLSNQKESRDLVSLFETYPTVSYCLHPDFRGSHGARLPYRVGVPFAPLRGRLPSGLPPDMCRVLLCMFSYTQCGELGIPTEIDPGAACRQLVRMRKTSGPRYHHINPHKAHILRLYLPCSSWNSSDSIDIVNVMAAACHSVRWVGDTSLHLLLSHISPHIRSIIGAGTMSSAMPSTAWVPSRSRPWCGLQLRR